MQFSHAAIEYVAGLVVPEDQWSALDPIKAQEKLDALANQKKLDGETVEKNIKFYIEDRLAPIVLQLRLHTGDNYEIAYQTHGYKARIRGKQIRFEPPILNQDPSILALLIAHEWAHLNLGHIKVSAPGDDEEYLAEYWAGVFLGKFGYDLKKVIQFRLASPPTEEPGSPYERALHIAQGYLEGLELRKGIIHLSALPGLEAFKTQSNHAPWYRPDVNKLAVETTVETQERSSFNPFK